LKRSFHEQSNRAKNAALYVDFDGTRFTSPDASITVDMLAKTGDWNAEFLGLTYPKLRMLREWAENFDDSAELLDGFVEFAEKLKAAHTEELDEVAEAIMNELHRRLLRKTKPQLRD